MYMYSLKKNNKMGTHELTTQLKRQKILEVPVCPSQIHLPKK